MLYKYVYSPSRLHYDDLKYMSHLENLPPRMVHRDISPLYGG